MIGGRVEQEQSALDALHKADLREAYERGRRDERSGRKRHPLLMTVMFLLAAVGAALLAMAAVNGSFMRAGDVVDQQLNVAAERAGPAARDAAGDAGESLRDAGRSLGNRTQTAG